jgi:hypothetical protein
MLKNDIIVAVTFIFAIGVGLGYYMVRIFVGT